MVEQNFLQGKRVLVTGCCGTVGQEVVRQLLSPEGPQPAEMIGLDNNESELFYQEQANIDRSEAHFILGDIRDQAKLTNLFDGVDVIFHCAAYKHVMMCEREPFEAVQTNIQGVQNVISAALNQDVAKVILASSDKAVNPTNVMGTSKLMGERLMTAANANLKRGRTIFAATRFGNVLGSRGSVIPLFIEQIRKGGPIRLTDERMTRFIMSLDEAVGLLLNSARMACGGEVFVTKMPAIRIVDLARVMIDELAAKFGHDPAGIELEQVGIQPGEKLYEELVTEEETRRAVELERYFAVLPAFRSFYRSIGYEYQGAGGEGVEEAYTSTQQPPLSRAELREFLVANNLLPVEADPDGLDRLRWPGESDAS